jgi:hypothetical protein
MSCTEILRIWHEEITGKLAEVEPTVAPAVQAVRLAEETADSAWREIRDCIVGRLRKDEPLAGQLAYRLAEVQRTRDGALAAVARLKGALANINVNVADLYQALAQLSPALTGTPADAGVLAFPAMPAHGAAAAPVRDRDFDDMIEFARPPSAPRAIV